MNDIKKRLENLRYDLGEAGTGIHAQLFILNDIILTFFEYLIEIEEDGRADPEL